MLLLALPFGAVVSSYPIVGWRQVLLLDVPFDGGFVLPYCRFASSVAFGRPFGGGFVLSIPRCALGVGFRRYPEFEKALGFLFRPIWVENVAFDLLPNYAIKRESIYFGVGILLTVSNETAAYGYSARMRAVNSI